MGEVATHCSYCALQCAMWLDVDQAANRVLKVRGRKDFPTTRGMSCVKGVNAHLQLDHAERLTTPLIREAGRLRRASWSEALGHAARRLQEVAYAHGAHANAVFGSGALPNEAVYLLSKFARVALKTRNIDYNGRFCMSSAAAAQNAVLGLDRGLHFPLSDIESSRCVLIVGANIGECLPPILPMLRRMKAAGGKLMVADPRRHETARAADLHLRTRPGSDLALALALLREVAQQKGLDEGYLEARCGGWREALAAVEHCTPQWCEDISGVPAADLRQAAGWLWTEKPALILTGRGAEQHAKGPETAMAFLQLALALGQVGKPSAGFGTLTGQGNGQGGREQGQKADQLPGYRSIENAEDRERMAAFWGIPEPALPHKGLSAQELFQARHRGEIRGLWVVGSNPVVSTPDAGQTEETLRGLDFLMVSDLFMSETCEFAEVVLPCAAYAEDEGTMTNIEGRVVLRRAAVAPPGLARPDWWIISSLAARLGQVGGFSFATASEVFEEFKEATRGGRADYSGMNYERLEEEKGLFWPCPGSGHPGTPRLFEKRFQHPDGLAHFQVLRWRLSEEEPDEQYPLRLTTGRVLHHYLSGTQTRRIPAHQKAAPQAFIEVAPELASSLGLKEGKPARLVTRRGSLELPLKLSPGMDPGTVFVPMHWSGEGRANTLTLDALAPLSKMPEFKHCAVRLEPALEEYS